MKRLGHLAHDWYPAPLPGNVEVGAQSWLHSSFAFLHSRSRKRPAVRIGRHSGVYLGSWFDLGPSGQVTIGDYSTLVSVVIATNGAVAIGDYCFLAHDVVIADAFAAMPWPARRVASRAGARPALSVRLGDDVWVGAGTILLRGARLGDGAVVGAGTVVDFPVPPYAVVAGNPARIVGDARAKRGARRR